MSAPEVSIARLPVTTGELFGRERELAWLDACWQDGVHVATVVAWGGVGKSALVNRWLTKMRDDGWRRAERVFGWSFYSQGMDRLSSSDEFVDAALRAFGDKDPKEGSPWDKGERLARWVRRERTILVLDGMEPLQWGPGVEEGKLKDTALQALVRELGGQNNGLCLITSRIGVADLEALAGHKVQALALEKLAVKAGAELLKARGARGADEEMQAAAQEYDGHSLALTLLGSYIRKAHRGDIRRRHIIRALEGKPVHRMMATYEKWFASMPESAILQMLGLFDRPAPQDEIAVLREQPPIAGLTNVLDGLPECVWNEAVTTLRDVGLLAASLGAESGDTLDAHPLVREYFGERLRREYPEAWREGHRRLYEHMRSRKAKPLPDTIEEMAPLYAAVVHGCLAGRNQEALDEVYNERIQRGREWFNLHRLGAFGAQVALLSAFFDPPWERVAPGLSAASQTYVLAEAAFGLRGLGRLSEAAGLMRRGLEESIAREDWKNAAQQANNFSGLLRSSGDLDQALVHAQKSVGFSDKSGDVVQRMAYRTALAATLHALGHQDAAASLFEQAEQMQQTIRPADLPLYSIPGFRYCDLLLDQGREADVLVRATRTLDWAETHLGLLDVALDHVCLGRAHILLVVNHGAQGDHAEAALHLRKAVEGLRRAARQDHLPLGLLARAALHIHTRSFADARRDLDETLSLAMRCGFRLHVTDTHLAYARLSLAEHDFTAALAHIAEASVLIGQTGYHRRDAELTAIAAATREMVSSAPRPVIPALPVVESGCQRWNEFGPEPDDASHHPRIDTTTGEIIPAEMAPLGRRPRRFLIRHSGSMKDTELVGELLAHLRPLERFAGIDIWTDDRVRAGDTTRSTVDEAIAEADVALLLLSADFLGSELLQDVEVPKLMERHRAGELRVIPVVLRSCVWEVHPWLAELRPLPRDGAPIALFEENQRDQVLTELTREIIKLATPATSG